MEISDSPPTEVTHECKHECKLLFPLGVNISIKSRSDRSQILARQLSPLAKIISLSKILDYEIFQVYPLTLIQK